MHMRVFCGILCIRHVQHKSVTWVHLLYAICRHGCNGPRTNQTDDLSHSHISLNLKASLWHKHVSGTFKACHAVWVMYEWSAFLYSWNKTQTGCIDRTIIGKNTALTSTDTAVFLEISRQKPNNNTSTAAHFILLSFTKYFKSLSLCLLLLSVILEISADVFTLKVFHEKEGSCP